MSVFVLGIPTAYAQEYSNTPSAISYVSELKAVNSDSASSAKSFLNGYTIIDHNFDVTGKRGIYIGYKTSTDIEQAITGIVFTIAAWKSQDGGMLMKRIAGICNGIPVLLVIILYVVGWVM